MKLDDLLRTIDIYHSVQQLIREVEEETGKPIDFRIDNTLKVPITVKIARDRMPHHVMKIHPKQERVASYLIANKCTNIRRMMSADPSDRLVVTMDESTFENAAAVIIGSLGTKAAQLPVSMLQYFANGVINQLSNLPIQIRIERWVKESFPDLADQQQRYLEADIKETLGGVTNEIEKMTPAIIFNTSNAMTYAWTRGVGELLGTNLTQKYSSYPKILRRGKDIYNMVGTQDGGTNADDVELITRWAEYLEIKDWFVWQNFEEMPESYYADVEG